MPLALAEIETAANKTENRNGKAESLHKKGNKAGKKNQCANQHVFFVLSLSPPPKAPQ